MQCYFTLLFNFCTWILLQTKTTTKNNKQHKQHRVLTTLMRQDSSDKQFGCPHQGHVQARTTFCYGFRVEQHVSWKRCATGFEIRFLLFGGCQKCQPNQQQHVYKPRGIKETARTMGPSEVVYYVHYVCSSVYATIEAIRRHVCCKSFIVT